MPKRITSDPDVCRQCAARLVDATRRRQWQNYRYVYLCRECYERGILRVSYQDVNPHVLAHSRLSDYRP